MGDEHHKLPYRGLSISNSFTAFLTVKTTFYVISGITFSNYYCKSPFFHKSQIAYIKVKSQNYVINIHALKSAMTRIKSRFDFAQLHWSALFYTRRLSLRVPDLAVPV